MSAILAVHLLQRGGRLNVKRLFLHCLLTLPVKMSTAHNVPVWNTTASTEHMHLNTGLLVCAAVMRQKASGPRASQEKVLPHQDGAAERST